MKKAMLLIVSLMILSLLATGWSQVVEAGAWDEHLLVQTVINGLLVNSDVGFLQSDLACFLAGVAQHQIYDLAVNERPIHVNRFVRRKEIPGQIDGQVTWEVNFAAIREELPSIILNLTGIGFSGWQTQHQFQLNGNPAHLRARFFGLLGSVTPDILEATRLVLMGGEGAYQAWTSGDTEGFHVSKPEGWRYPIDTVRDNKEDLKRRGIIHVFFLTKEILLN